MALPGVGLLVAEHDALQDFAQDVTPPAKYKDDAAIICLRRSNTIHVILTVTPLVATDAAVVRVSAE